MFCSPVALREVKDAVRINLALKPGQESAAEWEQCVLPGQ